MKKFTLITALIAAVMMTAVTGCASTATQESTGQYVDDSLITTKVKAGIVNEPTLKATEINVETFKGIVQLSGFVSSESAMARALAIAGDVKGVQSVKNDMRLK